MHNPSDSNLLYNFGDWFLRKNSAVDEKNRKWKKIKNDFLDLVNDDIAEYDNLYKMKETRDASKPD